MANSLNGSQNDSVFNEKQVVPPVREVAIPRAEVDRQLSHGDAKEFRAASVALTSAVEAQKPSLLSKNMLKLYGIMAIGYLVSTMNGYDSSLMVSNHSNAAVDE